MKAEVSLSHAAHLIFSLAERRIRVDFDRMNPGMVATEMPRIHRAGGLVRWDGWPRTLPLNTSLRHHFPG